MKKLILTLVLAFASPYYFIGQAETPALGTISFRGGNTKVLCRIGLKGYSFFGNYALPFRGEQATGGEVGIGSGR